MKDFMSYTMFNDMGVAAPLSSYSVLQKNGEDFGLYLSVEAVEDSFRIRNYGKDDVNLYKPEIFDLNKLATDGMTDRQQLLQIISGEYYADKGKGDRLDILYDLWGYVFTPEFSQVPSLKYIGDNAEDYNALWDSSVFKCTDEDKCCTVSSTAFALSFASSFELFIFSFCFFEFSVSFFVVSLSSSSFLLAFSSSSE